MRCWLAAACDAAALWLALAVRPALLVGLVWLWLWQRAGHGNGPRLDGCACLGEGALRFPFPQHAIASAAPAHARVEWLPLPPAGLCRAWAAGWKLLRRGLAWLDDVGPSPDVDFLYNLAVRLSGPLMRDIHAGLQKRPARRAGLALLQYEGLVAAARQQLAIINSPPPAQGAPSQPAPAASSGAGALSEQPADVDVAEMTARAHTRFVASMQLLAAMRLLDPALLAAAGPAGSSPRGQRDRGAAPAAAAGRGGRRPAGAAGRARPRPAPTLRRWLRGWAWQRGELELTLRDLPYQLEGGLEPSMALLTDALRFVCGSLPQMVQWQLADLDGTPAAAGAGAAAAGSVGETGGAVAAGAAAAGAGAAGVAVAAADSNSREPSSLDLVWHLPSKS